MMFENVPAIKSSLATQRIEYAPPPEVLTALHEMTDQEIMAQSGQYLTFDVECYPNYFLIMFAKLDGSGVITFEISPEAQIDKMKLRWVIESFTCIGFNSLNYDMHMVAIALAIHEPNTLLLKDASNDIIGNDMRLNDLKKKYVYEKFHKFDHIDIIEVAPLTAGLKTYAGRLHAPKMQDLPYHHEKHLTQFEAKRVKHYCLNDNVNTAIVFKEIEKHIDLRADMGITYNLDLRSKSDAQIAEHVIKSEIKKLSGTMPKRPIIDEGTLYKYNMPQYLIDNCGQHLKPVLEKVEASDFSVKKNGSIQLPKELNGYKIKIGKSEYKLGIGGLHSCEKSISYQSNQSFMLTDVDVASYYPRIILNQGLFPKHIGELFLKVYDILVNRRLAAKANKMKLIADALKIVINGSFGKLGSVWSALYSPDLMIQVTVTGQLSLLLLIEQIEAIGISVISANTDGVVSNCPRERYDEFAAVVKEWERQTDFVMEETRYKALYSRDVNNYIAIKEDNEAKAKGVYSEFGSALNSVLSKNPEYLICSDAVKKFLSEGVPVETTIKNCKDIKRFVSVRQVKGGAMKDGYYLGSVIRWYYKKNEWGAIHYKTSGNKVPKSEGAWPLMDLPDNIPEDIDFTWYIQEAKSILQDIGFIDNICE